MYKYTCLYIYKFLTILFKTKQKFYKEKYNCQCTAYRNYFYFSSLKNFWLITSMLLSLERYV